MEKPEGYSVCGYDGININREAIKAIIFEGNNKYGEFNTSNI
jgi:hypothetical protein